ncbi:hypothetical protein HNV12_27700 [Methanococcoides sp. SA1]|nr:hypothetical protein [Methanococcoides sp. SA1]
MVFFTILVFTYHVGQLLWGIIAIATVFWLFMLYDCLQRNADDFPSKGDNEKLIWSLVLIFLNFIGAVLYYYLVRMRVWMVNNYDPRSSGFNAQDFKISLSQLCKCVTWFAIICYNFIPFHGLFLSK